MSRFPEVVAKAREEYATQVLANYLYELATKFNAFYAHSVILGEKRREQLTWITGVVIKTGLAILGIEVVERM